MAESELDEAKQSLLRASKLTWNYVIMNGLAATLASYGLFANSPAVVIGAMIVAMLLGPISSLALGIINSNIRLMARSLFTLLVGIVVVCVVSAFWGWVNINSPITNEILIRTAPNLMDLMIATGGGMAGALSLVHKRLATAVVGVAIATALVPPLSSASILLARGESELALEAFLLTFTNIVGIQFGYALVLWLKKLEIVPKKTRQTFVASIKRSSIGFSIMIGLALLLAHNLVAAIDKYNFETHTRVVLAKGMESINGSLLNEVRFQKANGKLIIRAVMIGPYAPDNNTVAAFEEKIAPNYLHIPNELRIRFIRTHVITRNGELFDDDIK
jgi:uncharacterized hydrophobic protein (TIGR00271 family)